MLICIDVGNTNIVFGIYDLEDHLIETFRLQTRGSRTEDEYGIEILENLKYIQIDKTNITGIIISSVVPEIDSTLQRTFVKYFNKKPLFVAPGVKTGIKIKIDNPKQLGSDLLVGAVGAVSKYGCPCIVVDLGTATKLMVINDKKEFLGGIIYPGIVTSFSSLIKSTSLLESAKVEAPSSLIGRDTMTAIQSGMVYGTQSAVMGLIKMLIKEHGDMKVVITGGLSEFIAPYLDKSFIHDKNLLIDGLNIIYKKNREV